MAVVEVHGFSEFAEKLRGIPQSLGETILRDSLMAAADVYKGAIEANAPRRTGNLAGNIDIAEIQTKEYSRPDLGIRLKVGPTRRKGFYGYWLEEGWKATGRHRRARKASGTTHGQAGVTTYREIAGLRYIKRSYDEASAAAGAAAEAVLKQGLDSLA